MATLAVDFDGVLHQYVTPWIDEATIPDPPVAGAIEWLREVAAEFDIVVLTTRARDEGGIGAVEAWLRANGYDGPVTVTAEKVPAVMYIDDRAWRFSGRFPSLKTIFYAKPWRTGEPEPSRARDATRRAREQQKKVEQVAGNRKRELAAVRTELIREILRDKSDEWFSAWWEEAQRTSWEQRILLARAEIAQ